MPNLMHVIPRAGENPVAPVLPPFRWLYDDFERPATTPPDLSGGDVEWTMEGGGWHIAEVATATGNGVAVCDNNNLANAIADSRHTDYVISAAMRPVVAGTVTATAIIIRYLDENNYAWIGRNYSGGKVRSQMNAVIAGTPTQLAIDTYDWSGARVDVTVAGNQATTYMNGILRFGGPITLPAELATGTRVGMRAARGNGFGDFGVYSHQATSVGAPDYGMPDDD